MIPDSSLRYGSVTRFFHWLVTLLLIWMLLTASVHLLFEREDPIYALFPSHFQIGVTVLWVSVLRALWIWLQRKRRPKPLNAASFWGHLSLVVLTTVLPVIALLRFYGSGRPFSYLGLQLWGGDRPEIEWMVGLGNAVHGLLGWTLFILIAGHIVMAIKHQRGPLKPIAGRLWGPLPAQDAASMRGVVEN